MGRNRGIEDFEWRKKTHYTSRVHSKNRGPNLKNWYVSVEIKVEIYTGESDT